MKNATNHGLDQRPNRFWSDQDRCSRPRAAEPWSSLSAAWKHFSRWFWLLVELQEVEAGFQPLLNNWKRKRPSVVPKSNSPWRKWHHTAVYRCNRLCRRFLLSWVLERRMYLHSYNMIQRFKCIIDHLLNWFKELKDLYPI